MPHEMAMGGGIYYQKINFAPPCGDMRYWYGVRDSPDLQDAAEV